MDKYTSNFNTSTITGKQILEDVERMRKLLIPPSLDNFTWCVHEKDYHGELLETLNGQQVIVHHDRTIKEPKYSWWWWKLLCNRFQWSWLFSYRIAETLVKPGTVLRFQNDFIPGLFLPGTRIQFTI